VPDMYENAEPHQRAANIVLDMLAALRPDASEDENLSVLNIVLDEFRASGSVRIQQRGPREFVAELTPLLAGVELLLRLAVHRLADVEDKDRDVIIAELRQALDEEPGASTASDE
jgi:hypothetical protein